MSKVFITSDHHFGHSNLLSFTDKDGDYFRGDKFTSVEEMDSEMIRIWNEEVSANDKVYHLGDFCMSSSSSHISRYAEALNGRKVFIRGNHDRGKLSYYAKHFKDVRSTHLLETGCSPVTHVVLSHVPIHPRSLRLGWVNVHGHTHEKPSPHGPYFSVCVERHDYKPIEWNHLVSILNETLGPELEYLRGLQ